MKILTLLLLLAFILFPLFLYLARTYGHSTIHTDEKYIDGRLSYRVVHVQATWSDAIQISVVMTGIAIYLIGMFINTS
jgi:hypothetical protein